MVRQMRRLEDRQSGIPYLRIAHELGIRPQLHGGFRRTTALFVLE
jgi:hypothetical protein